uniref:Uncharacterized protein n=1 Tax=Phaeomonas parva TaxID=124430 RepID=A0A7S1UAT1_9STRA
MATKRGAHAPRHAYIIYRQDIIIIYISSQRRTPKARDAKRSPLGAAALAAAGAEIRLARDDGLGHGAVEGVLLRREFQFLLLVPRLGELRAEHGRHAEDEEEADRPGRLHGQLLVRLLQGPIPPRHHAANLTLTLTPTLKPLIPTLKP